MGGAGRRRLATMVLGALSATTALAACGNGEDRPGAGSATGAEEHGEHGASAEARFSRSQADSMVRVGMRDFAFEGISPTTKGPKVFFEASNQGPSEHELVVVDEDGKEVGEIPPFEKGATKTLAVELKPGRYSTRCVIKLGDRTHAQLGMEANFTVE